MHTEPLSLFHREHLIVTSSGLPLPHTSKSSGIYGAAYGGCVCSSGTCGPTSRLYPRGPSFTSTLASCADDGCTVFGCWKRCFYGKMPSGGLPTGGPAVFSTDHSKARIAEVHSRTQRLQAAVFELYMNQLNPGHCIARVCSGPCLKDWRSKLEECSAARQLK